MAPPPLAPASGQQQQCPREQSSLFSFFSPLESNVDDETILLDLIRALRILPDQLVYELLIPLESSLVVHSPLRVDPEDPDGIDPEERFVYKTARYGRG